MSTSPLPPLERALADAHPGLDSGAVVALSQYMSLLERWNRVYNLTAVRGVQDVIVRHVLDSLSIRPFLRGARLLDVGTGAGLPGLLLAIVDPHRTAVLLDSNAKKTRFCQHATTELGLENVEVVTTRCEDFVPAAAFDSIVCRALLDAAELYTISAPWLAQGGRLIHMKGRFPHAELQSLRALGAETVVEPVQVPGLDAPRHVVLSEAPRP